MKTKCFVVFAGMSLAAFGQAPELRRGISVDMAVTRSAAPMAEADRAGSRIVVVTRSGELFLEADALTLDALTEEFRRAGTNNVYIKADVGTPYSNVAAVFQVLRNAGAVHALLLSSQRDSADGRNAPPKGLEVSIGGVRDARDKLIALEADGPMLFGDAVRIIDAARSAGARVLLK